MIIDPSAKRLDWRDRVNLGAFVFVVGGLVTLMATIFLAPMFAALYMFCAAGFGLLVIHAVSLLRNWSLREFIAPLQRVLDSYIDMITDIALLLATLSIMTGALVITGVPTKLGALLVEAAGVNMAAMVAMAFIFGAILGTGLPPAPVYILVAIVIFPAITSKSPLAAIRGRKADEGAPARPVGTLFRAKERARKIAITMRDRRVTNPVR